MIRMLWHELLRHRTWVGMHYQGCETCEKVWSR